MATEILPVSVPAHFSALVGQFLVDGPDGLDQDSLPDIEPITGTITATPANTHLKLTDEEFGKVTLLTPPKVFTISPQGEVSNMAPREGGEPEPFVFLRATDDPANGAVDWTWHFQFNLQHGGRTLSLPSFYAPMPTGTVVDLWDIMPVKQSAGVQIVKGEKGDKGDSNYDIWLAEGNVGSPDTFFATLKGERGLPGEQGVPGIQGQRGDQGIPGEMGLQGERGDQGIPGIQGATGERGEKGDKGDRGSDGTSLNIENSVATVAELPVDAVAGNAYLVTENGHLYFREESGSYTDAGKIVGPAGEKGDQGEAGQRGEQGLPGQPGIQGERGDQGAPGTQGVRGIPGEQGVPGIQGEVGEAGPSAYQVWLSLGNTGTEPEFIASLRGPDGKSAYQSAVETTGFEGTEEEWIYSLHAPYPADGKSAYQVWLDLGNWGSEQDFIDSLKGDFGGTRQVKTLSVGDTTGADSSGGYAAGTTTLTVNSEMLLDSLSFHVVDEGLFTLVIDGVDVASTGSINGSDAPFENLNHTLTVGAHTIGVRGDVASRVRYRSVASISYVGDGYDFSASGWSELAGAYTIPFVFGVKVITDYNVLNVTSINSTTDDLGSATVTRTEHGNDLTIVFPKSGSGGGTPAQDTGWLVSRGSGSAAYGTPGFKPVAIRRIGNVVHVRCNAYYPEQGNVMFSDHRVSQSYKAQPGFYPSRNLNVVHYATGFSTSNPADARTETLYSQVVMRVIANPNNSGTDTNPSVSSRFFMVAYFPNNDGLGLGVSTQFSYITDDPFPTPESIGAWLLGTY